MKGSAGRLFSKMRMGFYKGILSRQKQTGVLSASEVLSLDVIRLLGKPTIGSFANFINVPLSNATYKINTLIQKGFLKKEKSERDRREFYLELTEKCNSLAFDDTRQLSVMERVEQRLNPLQLKIFEQILVIMDEEIKKELSNE